MDGCTKLLRVCDNVVLSPKKSCVCPAHTTIKKFCLTLVHTHTLTRAHTHSLKRNEEKGVRRPWLTVLLVKLDRRTWTNLTGDTDVLNDTDQKLEKKKRKKTVKLG